MIALLTVVPLLCRAGDVIEVRTMYHGRVLATLCTSADQMLVKRMRNGHDYGREKVVPKRVGEAGR